MAIFENPYDDVNKMMDEGIELVDIKLTSRLVHHERERVLGLIKDEMVNGVASITLEWIKKRLHE